MIRKLKQEHFNIESHLHGVMHTYRVMYNVILLSQKHELNCAIIKSGLFAAFIHDMARKHDGYCIHHGQWAIDEKFALFSDGFLSYGLNEDDLSAIKTAVIYHSLPEELEKNHAHYKVTALLKDADALDRIRLGKNGLDPGYLRLPHSWRFITTAEEHFYHTEFFSEPDWDMFSDLMDSNDLTKGLLAK